MSVNQKKMTMGLIVVNRGFFPDHLAKRIGSRARMPQSTIAIPTA
jgi:hypothetical protein